MYECIEMEQCTPTHEQARRMRRMYDEGKLTSEAIEAIMLEEKPNQKEKIVLLTTTSYYPKRKITKSKKNKD